MLYSRTNKIATAPEKARLSFARHPSLSLTPLSCQIPRTSVREEFPRGEKTERKKDGDGTAQTERTRSTRIRAAAELSHVGIATRVERLLL